GLRCARNSFRQEVIMGYFGHETLVWVEILSIFGFAVLVAILDTVEWDGCIEQDKADLVHH
ncbi:hypothetical protein, partial [Ferrovum sp.]|uniref:hypothetical protein n=1 Tax=Ferrovum sp. TaxID=2609467 RepID=UPI0026223D1C